MRYFAEFSYDIVNWGEVFRSWLYFYESVCLCQHSFLLSAFPDQCPVPYTNTKLLTSPRHCNCPAFSINLITITFPRKTVKKRNYSHTNSFKLIKWRLCNCPRIHIFDIHLIHHCFNRNEYMLLHF